MHDRLLSHVLVNHIRTFVWLMRASKSLASGHPLPWQRDLSIPFSESCQTIKIDVSKF